MLLVVSLVYWFIGAPMQSAKGTVLYFFFISPYFYNSNKYPSDEKILFLQLAESNVFFGLKHIEKNLLCNPHFCVFFYVGHSCVCKSVCNPQSLLQFSTIVW